MAIRNMALPLLGGGALILGYAAFALFRTKRAREVAAPITLRETGLEKTMASESTAREPAPTLDDGGPLSERSPLRSDILELEQLEHVDELPRELDASVHDAVAPEDLGALFLARATDALSPFGSRAGHGHFDLDQFALEGGLVSEATARAANGDDLTHGSRERAAESERRPSAKRPRGRS